MNQIFCPPCSAIGLRNIREEENTDVLQTLYEGVFVLHIFIGFQHLHMIFPIFRLFFLLLLDFLSM